MKTRSARRIRDFAAYIAIGLVCCIGALWYASESGADGADRFARWGGLALNTLLLYGYVITYSKGYLRRLSFWMPLILILTVHLGTFALILSRAEHWKALWFLAMYPIELPIIAAVCWRRAPAQTEAEMSREEAGSGRSRS
jgi:hypothetical protein